MDRCWGQNCSRCFYVELFWTLSDSWLAKTVVQAKQASAGRGVAHINAHKLQEIFCLWNWSLPLFYVLISWWRSNLYEMKIDRDFWQKPVTFQLWQNKCGALSVGTWSGQLFPEPRSRPLHKQWIPAEERPPLCTANAREIQLLSITFFLKS